MKNLLMLVSALVLSYPVYGQDRFPVPERSVYRITGDLDLNGATITLTEGSTVDLSDGTLRNGTLVGNRSSLTVPQDREVLDGVALTGTWQGKVCDRWFRLDGRSAYQVLSALMRFNEVHFDRSEYWLDEWRPIYLNGESMQVYGHGVRIFLPADKGDTEQTSWGPRYRKECLFCPPLDGNLSRGVYHFRDMSIEDNARVILQDGWGEDPDQFRIYYYFETIGRELVFENISSDGVGILVKVYNFWQHIDRIEMNGCIVKAGQFALEVGNLTREGYPGGSCGDILLRDCRFYQYPCQPYVGLLSVVGDVLTERMLIEKCFFDASEKDGNLELSSVRHVVFRNNTAINQFLNSYQFPRIEKYDILNNTFFFRKHRSKHSFNFGGEEVLFKNNRLVYEVDDVGFITVVPQVKSLEMDKNVFDFSRVKEITEDRTAIAMKGAALTGLKVRMFKNKVVPPPEGTHHRIIFRLPARMEGSVGNQLEGVLIR